MILSRFFIVGIRGPRLEPEEAELFSEFPPGGVILFARNIEAEGQLRALVEEVRALVPGVTLYVDQEGGPVDRFRSIAGRTVSFARAARLGRAGEAGGLAGELLASFDIDVDLAPVVDRAVEGAGGRVLHERCASDDPEQIVSAAAEFIRGLSELGIASCLKHFPGLGRAESDTHVSLPRIEFDAAENQRDLAPFRQAGNRAQAVMVSHAAIAPSIMPASMDAGAATHLLRIEEGLPMVSITDDLEMGALEGFGPLPRRAGAAFAAGCDLLVIGKDNAALPEAVANLEHAASAERLAEAESRLQKLLQEIRRLKREGRPPRPVGEIAAAASALRLEGESIEL